LIVRDPENHKKKLWIKERDVLEQIEAVFASIQVPKAYLFAGLTGNCMLKRFLSLMPYNR